MKRHLGRLAKWAAAALALLLALALVVPYVNADQYGQRLKWSLERALGRRVELGKVRFGLLTGPSFSVDSVTIYEDPTIGLEPIAYVQEPGSISVSPQLWPLLFGRFVISSIRLDSASINLTKSTPPADPGHWNFESFVNRTVMRNPLAIHIRNSRVNFKFGDTKAGFYLTETDLDIAPPGSLGGGWKVYCAAKTARTDRIGLGLGSFSLKGRWFLNPERVDMDLLLDRTSLGDWTALFRGDPGAVHGAVTAHLHLGGPINNIGLQGRVNIEDVHRWDLLPPHGQGWPLYVSGRLDLIGEQFEMQSSSADSGTLPLSLRFRASDYLGQPHWAVSLNWNRFPVGPLMELATDMGAQFPPKLKLSGTIDGALGYSSAGSLQGELAFHDTAVAIPDSPPVRFEQAYVILDHGHVQLSPSVVHMSEQDQAEIAADYAMGADTFDLKIHSESMKVESLRAQVALAAVPWLEQVKSGAWSGDLQYHREPETATWTGHLAVHDAQIEVPGLANPVQLTSARAQIDGARVVLDQIEGAAGKVAFTGEYRYEPEAARPHRVKLRAEELDAADLEKELLPTLGRDSSLIARALGRTGLPDWMKQRAVDGAIQIDALTLGGEHLSNVRAHLIWDVARLELDALQAHLERANLAGRLTVNLRGARPAYKLVAKVKGLNWQSGKVDVDGTLETAGFGRQLLVNMTSEGTFTGSALDFGTGPPWRTVSGSCNLAWTPKLRVTGIKLNTDDETYTGRGTTQDDGRLVILLSNGAKEMRMTGSLARLKLEDTLK